MIIGTKEGDGDASFFGYHWSPHGYQTDSSKKIHKSSFQTFKEIAEVLIEQMSSLKDRGLPTTQNQNMGTFNQRIRDLEDQLLDRNRQLESLRSFQEHDS